jgi:hypothetical protein
MAEKARLSPVSNYAAPALVNGKSHRGLYYGDGYGRLFFKTEISVDVILAEYLLCEIVQRQEFVNCKILVSKKIAADGHDDKEAESHQ